MFPISKHCVILFCYIPTNKHIHHDTNKIRAIHPTSSCAPSLTLSTIIPPSCLLAPSPPPDSLASQKSAKTRAPPKASEPPCALPYLNPAATLFPFNNGAINNHTTLQIALQLQPANHKHGRETDRKSAAAKEMKKIAKVHRRWLRL